MDNPWMVAFPRKSAAADGRFAHLQVTVIVEFSREFTEICYEMNGDRQQSRQEIQTFSSEQIAGGGRFRSVPLPPRRRTHTYACQRQSERARIRGSLEQSGRRGCRVAAAVLG